MFVTQRGRIPTQSDPIAYRIGSDGVGVPPSLENGKTVY